MSMSAVVAVLLSGEGQEIKAGRLGKNMLQRPHRSAYPFDMNRYAAGGLTLYCLLDGLLPARRQFWGVHPARWRRGSIRPIRVSRSLSPLMSASYGEVPTIKWQRVAVSD
jgi:hypothetical protein